MENEQNRCSMTPFIYSIIPIGFAVGLVAFAASFPEKGGDFPGSLMDVLKPLILCCTAPLISHRSCDGVDGNIQRHIRNC